MSHIPQIQGRSRHAVALGVAAALMLFGASSANAQWAAKPAPALPHTLLDQACSGSVVLALVFESNGQVRDARVVRGSGISTLDQVARDGAMKWRLDPAALRPSDMTEGRQHLVKFFQNAQVSRRVEPVTAFWSEL